MEQLDSENLFKAAHELAHGGGRHVQLVGGSDVTEVPSSRLERAERVQVVGSSHDFPRKLLYLGSTDHLCCGFNRQRSCRAHGTRAPVMNQNLRTRRKTVK